MRPRISIWGRVRRSDGRLVGPSDGNPFILNAENGSNRIVAGNETNSSGAFLSSVKIELQEGLYTILAQGNLGSFATAPLLVSSKWICINIYLGWLNFVNMLLLKSYLNNDYLLDLYVDYLTKGQYD